MLYECPLPSPLGTLTLVADDAALVAVLWPDDRPGRVALPARTIATAHPLLIKARAQLDEYFAGTRTRFELPLAPPA